jgi:predicted nucleotidyltransferase
VVLSQAVLVEISRHHVRGLGSGEARQQRVTYNADMAKAPTSAFPFPPPRFYGGPAIPMRVIRRYARAIAKQFQPDKIILFGSIAYGTPHADSDVDLLVIMPARNQLDQAFKIHCALCAPFPMDLIVRTPKEVNWRLAEGESFLTEVLSKGKTLYEKTNQRIGPQSRKPQRVRSPRAKKSD